MGAVFMDTDVDRCRGARQAPGDFTVAAPRDTWAMSEPRVPCVGAIITGGGRILLIRRGHEPEAGRWSLPGGRIEAGETDQQALVREVREETGLEVAPGRLIGAVDRPAAGGRVLVIRDYAATVTGGVLRHGDDADDARWFSMPELDGLPLSTGLKEALNDWGVVGRVPSHALIAAATRRAGVIWLTVPGRDRPIPAWHIWRDPPGAAYLVTGPGEQPLPGVAGASQVTVTVPSKDTGGALVTWLADVHRVDPGSPEWEAVIGPLAAGRLNAALDSRSVIVFRLAPESSRD
jgi:ADP-ribose pyrophosphatase YjhB (NUDIX family)